MPEPLRNKLIRNLCLCSRLQVSAFITGSGKISCRAHCLWPRRGPSPRSRAGLAALQRDWQLRLNLSDRELSTGFIPQHVHVCKSRVDSFLCEAFGFYRPPLLACPLLPSPPSSSGILRARVRKLGSILCYCRLMFFERSYFYNNNNTLNGYSPLTKEGNWF